MYLCQHPLLLYNQMKFLGWFAWYAADYLSGEAKQYFKGDGGGGGGLVAVMIKTSNLDH